MNNRQFGKTYGTLILLAISTSAAAQSWHGVEDPAPTSKLTTVSQGSSDLLCKSASFASMVQGLHQENLASSRGSNALLEFQSNPGQLAKLIAAVSTSLGLGMGASYESMQIEGNQLTLNLSSPKLTIKLASDASSLKIKSVYDAISGKESVCNIVVPKGKPSSLPEADVALIDEVLRLEAELVAGYKTKEAKIKEIQAEIAAEEKRTPSALNFFRRGERAKSLAKIAALKAQAEALEPPFRVLERTLAAKTSAAAASVRAKMLELKNSASDVSQMNADKAQAEAHHQKAANLTRDIDHHSQNARRLAASVVKSADDFNQKLLQVDRDSQALSFRDRANRDAEMQWTSFSRPLAEREVKSLEAEIESHKRTIAMLESRLLLPKQQLSVAEREIAAKRAELQGLKERSLERKLRDLGPEPLMPSESTQEQAKLRILSQMKDAGSESAYSMGESQWKIIGAKSHWKGVVEVAPEVAARVNKIYEDTVLAGIRNKVADYNLNRTLIKRKADEEWASVFRTQLAPYEAKAQAIRSQMAPDESAIASTGTLVTTKTRQKNDKKNAIVNRDNQLSNERHSIRTEFSATQERERQAIANWRRDITSAESQRSGIASGVVNLHQRVKTDLTGVPGSQKVRPADESRIYDAKAGVDYHSLSDLAGRTSSSDSSNRSAYARAFADKVTALVALSEAEGASVVSEVQRPLANEITRLANSLSNYDAEQRLFLYNSLPANIKAKLQSSGLSELKQQLGLR